MQNIDKDTLRRADGASFVEFRRHLRPNYTQVWRDIGAGYAALLAISVALLFVPSRPSLWTIGGVVLGGALFGYTIAYLHLFFHEAAHFGWAHSRRNNDRLANALLGPLLMVDVGFYRIIHMAHHRLLGDPGDTENSYHAPLTARYVAESLFGKRVLDVFVGRNATRSVEIPVFVRKRQSRAFFFGAALHGTIVVAAALAGAWALCAAWVLGVACFTPFFGAIRQLLEHRPGGSGRLHLGLHPQEAFTRTFAAGPLGSTFGAAGFRRHLLHHWEPTLSYTCLADVEAFILDTRLGERYRLSIVSYASAFWELIADAYRPTPHSRAALPELRSH